jgi:hypothetical protein
MIGHLHDLYLHRTTQTQKSGGTNIHPRSGMWTHIPVFEWSRTLGAFDPAATYTGWFICKDHELIIINHAIIHRWRRNMTCTYVNRSGDNSVTEDAQTGFRLPAGKGRYDTEIV